MKANYQNAPPFRSGARRKGHAGDRVLQYLLAEFDRPDLKQGSRLPTIRELAVRLDVSAFTVQRVFQKLAREGSIRTEVGSGSFLVSASGRKPIVIALGIPVPGPSPDEEWSQRIYGGMMKAVMSSARPLTLIPLPQEEQDIEEGLRKLMRDHAHVDGLILFPVPTHEKIRSVYEREGCVVVELNPPSEAATTNFVSPDYPGPSRQLAEVWKATGRRRMVVLTSVLRTSVSSRLRLGGFAAGLGTALNRQVSLQVVEVDTWREKGGYQAMGESLAASTTPPDAVYCSGDFSALGALRALQEKRLRVPQDVSVVGGTGIHLSETPWSQLTRMKQPLEMMGENLITMLGQRIEQKGVVLPACILETPFIGGATTRPEENEMLGIRSASPGL